ncbi:uncharacterized protein LOC144798412 isoform X2 [Lissotriton helveticus]
MTDSGSGRSDHRSNTPLEYAWATDSDKITGDNSLNIRLVAAAVWAVVKRRDTEHFGKVLEFLHIVHQQVPDLVFYRHHAKLCAGLKGKLLLDMFLKMRCPLDILKALDNLFPEVLPEDPFATPHDLWKVGQCYQEFRKFTFHLIRDDKFRTHYLQVPSNVTEGPLIEAEQPGTPFVIGEPLVPPLSSGTDELREISKEKTPSQAGVQAHLTQKVSSVEEHLSTALLEGSTGNKGPVARIACLLSQKLVSTVVAPVEEQCCKNLFGELTAAKQTAVCGQTLSECASSTRAEDVTILYSDQEKGKIQSRERVFALSEDSKDESIVCDQPEQDCEEMGHQILTDALSRESSVQIEMVAVEKTLQESPREEFYEPQLMSTNESDTPELLAPLETGRGIFDKLDVHVPHEDGSDGALQYSRSAKKPSGSDVMATSELHFVQEVNNTNLLSPHGSSNHLIAGSKDMCELSAPGRPSSPDLLGAERACLSESLNPQAVCTTEILEAGLLDTIMVGNPSWIAEATGRDTERCVVSTAKKRPVFAALELDSSLEEIQKDEEVCSPPNPFQSQEMVDELKGSHRRASFGLEAAQQRFTVPKQSAGRQNIEGTTVKIAVQTSALTNNTYRAVNCKQGSKVGQNLDTEIRMEGRCGVPLGEKSCRFTSTVNTNIISRSLDGTGIPITEEREDCSISEPSIECNWVSNETVHSEEQERSSAIKASRDKTHERVQANVNSLQPAVSRASELNRITEARARCRASIPIVSNVEQVSTIASETNEMQTISTASEPCVISEEQTISTAPDPSVISEEQTVSTPSETSVSSEEQTTSTATEPSMSSEEQTVSTPSETSVSSEELTISTATEPSVSSEELTISTATEPSVSSEELTISTATEPSVSSEELTISTATEPSVSSEEQAISTASVPIMNTQHPATNQESAATLSSEVQTGSRTSKESSNCLSDLVRCNVCRGVGAIKRALGVQLLRQRNKIIPGAAEASPHVKVLRERYHLATRKRRASKEHEGAPCSLHGPSTRLQRTAHADLRSEVTREYISRTTVCAPANLFLHCSQFQPRVQLVRLSNQSLSVPIPESGLVDSVASAGTPAMPVNMLQNMLLDSSLLSDYASNTGSPRTADSVDSHFCLYLPSDSSDADSNGTEFHQFNRQPIHYSKLSQGWELTPLHLLSPRKKARPQEEAATSSLPGPFIGQHNRTNFDLFNLPTLRTIIEANSHLTVCVPASLLLGCPQFQPLVQLSSEDLSNLYCVSGV